MFPILFGLLATAVMFYCLWINPQIGRRLLSQSAPWLNDSVEGWMYRMAVLLCFLFMLGLTAWKVVTLLRN